MQTAARSELVEDFRETFRRWRLPLDEDRAEQFAIYLETLERWNRAVSLTSIRDRGKAILRHFVEPGMALSLLDGAGPALLDAGSGAGFPGLPLKILAPERSCTLVEANGRKAAFLREVVEALGLEETRVLEGRIEDLVVSGDLAGPIHVLTARAWTSYGPLLGLAGGLMAPGGRAVLLVGEETLRALRRHLMAGPGAPAGSSDDWGPARRAGWEIRRVVPLRHLDQGSAVSLELPSF